MNRVGQQLGNYRLIRLLGEGAFAEVYLGEHIHLGTQAAIKVLHTQLGRTDIEPFRNEARTIAHLEHPHIVRVLDFGVEGTTPFLVMGYAPKGTLRTRYPKGSRLPLATVVSYVQQVASALQYAHDQKLVHRDVKPENLLLGRADEILLSDFGIALASQSSQYQGQSTPRVAGTIAYMAPEQIQAHPCPASDQYSLGIVVYEWLSGERPFHGSISEIALKHSLVPPPSLLGRGISRFSPAVEQVVMTALAKDPRQRFDCILAFADALREAAQLPPHSRSTPALHTLPTETSEIVAPLSPQKRRSGKRSPLLIGGALGLSLLIVLVITVWSIIAMHRGSLPLLGAQPKVPLVTTTPPMQVAQRWAFHTGDPVTSSPTVINGVLYVGSGDKKVYGIDTGTGQQKWAFATGGYVASSPTVVDGVLYVGSGDNKVYAVDARTGQQRWAFPTGGYVRSSPMLVDGVLYVGSGDNKVYAVDARTGQQKWAFPTGSYVRSSPTIVDGVLYIGSWDHKVYALDARTGQQKWTFPTGGPVDSSPLVVNGMLYVGSNDSSVYGIDARTGQQKWAFVTGGYVASAPAVVNGVLYISSDKVYALDARTGQQKWAFSTVSKVFSSPTVVNGVLYIGSDKVYALDAKTGQQRWAFAMNSEVVSTPTVVNGVLYVGSDDGYVYALTLLVSSS
jgi:serine/threonine-protein kinase